jgi:hypothetical protein
MAFLIKQNNETTSISIDLYHSLNEFFISHAIVKNGELVRYATNDERWFKEFQKHWGDDAIVSQTPPVQKKLSVIEWALPLVKPEHKSFYDHRYNITGSDFGFTSFRSYLCDGQVVSAFYAIGSRETSSYSQSMILDPIYLKQSFRSIVPQFEAIPLPHMK